MDLTPAIIQPTTLSEMLLYTTVRIECETPDGPATGTGFFYRKKVSSDKDFGILVTNNHVVQEATSMSFLLHYAMLLDGKVIPAQQSIPVKQDVSTQNWIKHPDASIDLCGMPMAPLQLQALEMGIEPFLVFFDLSHIPTDEQLIALQALEEVTMVGYPRGLWDETNNYPLFRRGTNCHSSCCRLQWKE